jgi:nucleotide-binding universal stress UspA family protein
MFDRVVVAVNEFEAGRDALWLAKTLASGKGKLTLAHVQVESGKPAPDSGAVASEARRRDALERLAALRDESQLDAELVNAEARSVRRGLHDLAHSRHADLLVIGASRQDDIYRDLVGDDTRELLEDPPCAVAVAPVGYSEHRGPLRTIGVAYDGSPESDQALSVARQLAADRQAKLSAFDAVPGRLSAHADWDVEKDINQLVDEARERIEKLGGVEAHAEYGDPVRELGRYGQSVDLLVLGSHKHGPVGRLLRQGTAQRLADAAPCPLLVVVQDSQLRS